jgi:hypothetical protein
MVYLVAPDTAVQFHLAEVAVILVIDRPVGIPQLIGAGNVVKLVTELVADDVDPQTVDILKL